MTTQEEVQEVPLEGEKAAATASGTSAPDTGCMPSLKKVHEAKEQCPVHSRRQRVS